MLKNTLKIIPFLLLLILGFSQTVWKDHNNKTSSGSAVPIEEEVRLTVEQEVKGIKEAEQLMVQSPANEKNYHQVIKIIDGDTIDVNIDGKTERVRLIGINTPETVDPRKTVECFGLEASKKAKELLEGQAVELEADPSQDDRDKYGRLLRYARRTDGLFYNLEIIKLGYAYEYTYNIPCKYQTEFKAAESEARANKFGLWAPDACASLAPTETKGSDCLIKGNINSNGEKIYHLVGCDYYDKTNINTSAGEKWFCTEEEAITAGWRKAQNCK